MILAAFTFSSATAQEVKEEKKIIKIKMITDDDGNVTIDTTIVLDEDFDGDWKTLIEDEHDIHVKTIEGDTTLTFVIKTADCKKEGAEKHVMIWSSDGKDMGEHDIILKKLDGDSNVMIVTTVSAEEEVHGDAGMSFVTVTVDDDGNVVKKHIRTEGGEFYMDGNDIEVKDIDGAIVIISTTIIVMDAGDSEKAMLEEAGVKMGKDPLHIHDFKISMEPHTDNIKVEFTVHDLSNVSISFLDGNGKQIFLAELKALDGKYIREIEIPDGDKGDYFFHVLSGRESMTKKITLE